MFVTQILHIVVMFIISYPYFIQSFFTSVVTHWHIPSSSIKFVIETNLNTRPCSINLQIAI
jgi:hypothetical protein